MAPDRSREALEPLLAVPDRTAVVTDFDGTLAPIIEDPAASRPFPGVPDLLARLARRYARVAVVSGRPASFLHDRLGGADGSLVLSGLYGLERLVGGRVEQHPEARPWAAAITEAAAAAEAAAPEGVLVERKGLSVTIHVRTAPHHSGWAASWSEAYAEATGLAVHPGRQSWELRPPLLVDKGTVLADLVAGLDAACFAGDDVGDLPAFDALDRLEAVGKRVLRIGVRSDEAPAELLERADLVVDGPAGVAALFEHLLT